jgi:hypothetical protein
MIGTRRKTRCNSTRSDSKAFVSGSVALLMGAFNNVAVMRRLFVEHTLAYCVSHPGNYASQEIAEVITPAALRQGLLGIEYPCSLIHEPKCSRPRCGRGLKSDHSEGNCGCGRTAIWPPSHHNESKLALCLWSQPGQHSVPLVARRFQPCTRCTVRIDPKPHRQCLDG